jgi:beta-glucuronidase
LPSHRSRAERIPARRAAAALIALAVAAAGCAPAARPGSLAPTLTVGDVDGSDVAFQNGIPVPTFDRQARRQIDLSGPWRVQRAEMDADLSLTARDASLDGILREANGREQPDHDDQGWIELDVPGALNRPPDGDEIGGWYRRSFSVSSTWEGLATTLKFGSANYIADVWLNGTHLGYHEGGYTPFAFDVTGVLLPGERNQISVRVDNPDWGTRNDIVPWGLADWWNYGGLTGPVWIEATPPTHVVRADVVPHLDGLDVSVVLRRAEVQESDASPAEASPTPSASPTLGSVDPSPTGDASASATPTATPVPAEPVVTVSVLPAEVRTDNLDAQVAVDLVAPGAEPIVTDTLPLPDLGPGDSAVLDTAFLLGGADLWSPASPALYVLHVTIDEGDGLGDELWTTFGLRDVSVNPDGGQLLLNGEPVMFTGVGLHDELIDPEWTGESDRAPAARITTATDLRVQLSHARDVNADLIRAGHAPANPQLLMLADRLGFAVWEEIPLYHFTPLTYGIAIRRGIPQQMLREMALRDMNRPSVLFHGLSNESTGADEREAALRTLHDIDRSIDGTRLTGQAAYGSMPDDPTHAPLDVAGFTFYYDVFYGPDAATGTARALVAAHRAHPDKPVLALEFGRWADGDGGTAEQARIFTETYEQLVYRSSGRGGFVGASVWWTLEDFTTMMPGIAVEHFGLFRPNGEARPAATEATRLFEGDAGTGVIEGSASDVTRAEVARDPLAPDLRLLGYLAYALGISLATLAGILALMLRRGGRAAPQR